MITLVKFLKVSKHNGTYQLAPGLPGALAERPARLLARPLFFVLEEVLARPLHIAN